MRPRNDNEGFILEIPGGTITGPTEEAVREAHAAFQEGRADAERVRERWGEDGEAAIIKLARSFPSLRSAAGVEPWDPVRFYLAALPTSSGARAAAAFVLSVWNSGTDWDTEVRRCLKARGERQPRGKLGAFHCALALQVWDRAHRAAFLAWAEAPFCP